jgi:predicted transcriptional regulator
MGKFGLLGAQLYPGEHLNYIDQLPGGINKQDFDYFHELIAHQEIIRVGAPGVIDGLKAGMVIGLPPVIKFG